MWASLQPHALNQAFSITEMRYKQWERTLRGSIYFIIHIVLKRKMFDFARVGTLTFIAEDPPTDGKSGILAIYSSIFPGNCDAGEEWPKSVRSSRRTW